ncbi:MAG: tryptophan synthase subunit alpha [Candidatus Omnitrophica bacterium]|nr:tryptophan synthase subunit alpha [Candidatus Omnitrophota bacterium]
MNRIKEKFNLLKATNKKAFITFITAGDPSLSVTERLVLEMDRSGVDVVELGVPFSDPTADGPRIQASSMRSLKAGTTLAKILNLVKKIRKKSKIPLVLMTYYNPVYAYGIKKFARDAACAGVDGVIVPDLPPEEALELIKESRRFNLANIFLLAPTSTKERIKKVIQKGSGFIYYVSLTGVTGERKTIPPDLYKKLKEIKSLTRKPVAVGFGVSRAAQIKSILKKADGVIVGSALVGIIEKNSNRKTLYKEFNKKIDLFSKIIHFACKER